MDISNQYHNISRILSKELLDTITDAEKEQLQSWVSESDENKRIYQKFQEDKWYRSRQLMYLQFDVDKAWAEIDDRITHASQVRTIKINYYKYVAIAASFLVLLSTYLLKDDLQTYFSPQATDPVITNNSIKPGSTKATLTLSNGEDIFLGEEDTIQVGSALSSGKEIVYSNGSTASSTLTYNTLTIPKGGQYELSLSDGTKVWLNSVTQVRYPVQFEKGRIRQIELVYGEIYLDVSSSTKHEGSRFQVDHKGQVVEVLGTEFNIKAYPREEVYTTLVEGRVKVSGFGKDQFLVPGQQNVLNLNTRDMFAQEVDVFLEVSWKDGIFSFKNKSLGAIMTVFSRWYDMEVQFKTPSLVDKTFNGTLRKDQSIEDIMYFLRGTIDTYEINGRTLIIN